MQGLTKALEYGMHMRALVFRAVPLPGFVTCNALIRGLRPYLQVKCKRLENGQVRENLDNCFAYAVGREHELPIASGRPHAA
jgi:hypothetical protein